MNIPISGRPQVDFAPVRFGQLQGQAGFWLAALDAAVAAIENR